MINILINISLLLCLLLNTSVYASSNEDECIPLLIEYEKRHGGNINNEKYSDKDRLKYLLNIQVECQNNAMYTIFYANVLVDLKNFDKMFEVLDEAIKLEIQPLAHLLHRKGHFMYLLSHAEIRKFDYDEIKLIYLQALKEKNTIEPLIYLGLAEVALLNSLFDEAMGYASKGAQLDASISRFFTIGSIIESKKGNYAKSIKFIEIAITKDGDRYLQHPDVVLAIANALCQMQRSDLVENIINQSAELINFYNHPELLEAKKIARECTIPVTNKYTFKFFNYESHL